ncbi:MAG: hypothetical protein Hens2KO_29410 [Henriciella sp.]
MIRPLFISFLALGVMAPAAAASCDISDTKCAMNGGKCNIKFINKTGDGSGLSRGADIKQMSLAQSVKVKAVKDNGNKAGNALTISDGASKTMNIDKKANKNFAKVRISSPNMATIESVNMSCNHVKAVLNGNGTCKIFYGYSLYRDNPFKYALGYHCDGGNVMGPKI